MPPMLATVVTIDTAPLLQQRLQQWNMYGARPTEQHHVSGIASFGADGWASPPPSPARPTTTCSSVRSASPCRLHSRAAPSSDVRLSQIRTVLMPRLPERQAPSMKTRPASPRRKSPTLPSRLKKSNEAEAEPPPTEVRDLLVSIYRDKNAPPVFPMPLSPPRTACGTSRAKESMEQLSKQFNVSSERVLSRLHNLRGLHLLSPLELRRLLERGRHRSHARYSYIAREGASCRGVTIVIAGEVECASQSHGVAAEHVPPGHAVGEPALLTGHALRHEHTLKALSDVYTFTLTHADFDGLRLSLSPSDHANANARILGAMPFFVSVEPAIRRKLGALLDMQPFRLSFTYPDPTPVVREGEEGAPFYFIIEGTIALHRRAADGVGKEQLGTLTPYSQTPWFGSIEGGAAPANAVVATEPCRCLVLKADKVASFLAHAPGFARVVTEADAALLRPAHHDPAAQA